MEARETSALKQWLTQDQLTYAEARARLASEFGVKSSAAALSKWYARHCQPQPSGAAQPAPLILDVVLQSTRPIRLRILHCEGRLKIITKPAGQRALNSRKTINCGGES